MPQKESYKIYLGNATNEEREGNAMTGIAWALFFTFVMAVIFERVQAWIWGVL